MSLPRLQTSADSNVRKSTFVKCGHHPEFSLSLFCEQCNESICVYCGHDLHQSHATINLKKKSKEVVERLGYFLNQCHKQELDVEEKRSTLTKWENDIKTSAAAASDKVKREFQHVMNEVTILQEENIQRIN